MSADSIPSGVIAVVLGSVVGFATILTMVWNSSKSMTTLKLNHESQEKRHLEEMKALEKKHLEDVQDLKLQIEKAKVERRDEIAKAVGNQLDRFDIVQKQLDGTKSDVKDISSRVTQLDQKSRYADEAIKELKDALNTKLDAEKSFFADWNQRIEDRISKTHDSIEKLRQEFLNMFTAFHANTHRNSSRSDADGEE